MFPRGLSGRGDNYTALVLTRWQTASLGYLTLNCEWQMGACILFMYYLTSKWLVLCLFFSFFWVNNPFYLASAANCLIVLFPEESTRICCVLDSGFSSSQAVFFSHSCWATDDSVNVTLEPPVSSSRWTGSGPTLLPASSPHPCRRPSPWATRWCTAALKTGLWTPGRNMCSSSLLSSTPPEGWVKFKF